MDQDFYTAFRDVTHLQPLGGKPHIASIEWAYQNRAYWEAIRLCERLFGLAHLGGAEPCQRGWAHDHKAIRFMTEPARLGQVVNSVPNIIDSWDHVSFYRYKGQARVCAIVLQPYNRSQMPDDGESEHAIWRRMDEASWWLPPHTGLLVITPKDLFDTGEAGAQ